MEEVDFSHMNGHSTTLSNVTPGVRPALWNEKESSFKVHRFEQSVLNQNVVFEVLKMNSSLYIYVGVASSNTLEGMCMSIPTRFDPVPLTSTWFGEPEFSQAISQKLSKKLNKPVVLSFNIADRHAVPHIERALFEDIRNNTQFY